MSYTWMITFSDITDEVVKRLTDAYLQAHPDPSNNYYNLTALKFISFANSYGIDVTTVNQLDRSNPNMAPHYLVIQWLITCFQMLVSQNLVGLNNDPISDDKWMKKYNMYRQDLKTQSVKLTYETIVSGLMQQNYTRAKNTFDIMC